MGGCHSPLKLLTRTMSPIDCQVEPSLDPAADPVPHDPAAKIAASSETQNTASGPSN